MNKVFYIFAFILLSTINSNCQNLVYNGDFEIYDTCPDNISHPNNVQLKRCIGWNSATKGTPDYYNSCSSNIVVSTPINIAGNQIPKSGNAYAGFLAYSYQPLPNEIFWWEYLKVELTEMLIIDEFYTISFYVSPSELFKYSVSHLGISFVNYDYFLNDSLPITNLNYIEDPINFIDTNNWIKLNYIYQAIGGEKHLIIGNFRGLNTVLTEINNDTTLNNDSYYLIDNVEVNELENNFPNGFTPNGDGINDLLLFNNLPYEAELTIFNRWGECVYFSNDSLLSWDGKNQNGIDCTNGVYFYVIKTNNFTINRFVHLMR